MSEWSQALGGFSPEDTAAQTISGHRGLLLEEPLLFEQDAAGRCG